MKTIKITNFIENDNNKEKQKNYLNTKFELIKEISNEEMNKECFDCRKKDPKYISINNAIFLCEDCAQIHKTFPDNISFIIDNNLNLLSINYLNYLYYGGNANLDNFINYDYPGLQNYAPEILYKTQAMIYYREELKCKIEGKPKPISPNDIMAYKLVTENGLINIREGNKFILKKKSQNKLTNKDIINNYYNNYNNTFNTFNNYNYNNQDNLNNNMVDNNKVKYNKSKNLKYCSLVNKTTFFNEMKNLFDKKLTQSYNNVSTKSYNNIDKTQNKYKNYNTTINNNNLLTDQTVNKSLTYRVDESINYSVANATIANEPISTTRHLNNSAFSDESNKSPNPYNISRYIKPLVRKSFTKKEPLNNFYTEREKIKKKKLTIDLNKIDKYNDSTNTCKNRIYKQKKKILDYFRISKSKKVIKKRNDNNVIFENNNLQKNQLLDKINKSMKSYLYKKKNKSKNNSISTHNNNDDNNNNDINNQEVKIEKEKEDNIIIGYNNNYFHIINETCELDNNDYKNTNVFIKEYIFRNNPKKGDKRIPIKVNLNLTYGKINNNSSEEKKNKERKKKALKDKMEQALLEQEALHNLQFEKKDSDIFNNIICLNNQKDE